MKNRQIVTLDQSVRGDVVTGLDAQALSPNRQGEAQATPFGWQTGLEGNAAAIIAHPGEAVDQRHPCAADRGDMCAMHHIAAETVRNLGGILGLPVR